MKTVMTLTAKGQSLTTIKLKTSVSTKSLGKIPSQEEGWINMYPIVNEHYKVIISMRELAAGVREETHSGSYAQVLGGGAPFL